MSTRGDFNFATPGEEFVIDFSHVLGQHSPRKSCVHKIMGGKVYASP